MSTVLQHIGKYELHERLARTTLSELWKAYDPHLGKYVALKLLATQTLNDPEYSTRFFGEVQALSTLRHPNIVRLYDARVFPSQDENVILTYISSEYVDGQTLADVIRAMHRQGRTPNWAEIIRIFVAIATALDYAHRNSVVHGNLKPTNIILSSSSTQQAADPILTDFGLAKILGHSTNTRRSLDTIYYISPEQAKGGAGDKASDIYALSVMLYEICTGVVPFQGTRPISILMQHAQAIPQSPSLIVPNIPLGLTHVIMRGLSKDPARRFPDALTMATALTHALDTSGPTMQEYKSTQTPPSREQKPFQNAAGPQIVEKPLAQPAGYATTPVSRSNRQRQRLFLTIGLIALAALLVTSLGAVSLLQGASVPASVTGVVGHGSFVSTGLTNDTNGLQGLNDELQLDLSSIPDPAAGTSYYGWLLPDKLQNESSPIFIGKLTANDGRIHILYTDASRNNLLAITSRFLITEESSAITPTVPSVDTSTWRYYAELPQAGSTTNSNGFTMLDHFRHLLVELPELQKYNLHGGLAVWLLQNTRKVETLATDAKDAVQAQNYSLARGDLQRIIAYLDSSKTAQTDLPAGMSLPGAIPNDQIGLLGGNVNNTDDPGYIRLVGLHLTGMLSLPPATKEQRQNGSHIVSALDSERGSLQLVHNDARTLLGLSDTQLDQTSSVNLLNDMVTQSYYAYSGYPDQHTLQTQGGAVWIHSAIQRLVDYSITPYKA